MNKLNVYGGRFYELTFELVEIDWASKCFSYLVLLVVAFL